MKNKKALLQGLKVIFGLGVGGFLLIGLLIAWSNIVIIRYAKQYIVESISELPDGKLYQTVIVPGARVYGNKYLSHITQDRADTAKTVIDGGHALTILVSGDNRAVDYDEVRTIKKYLVESGLPTQSIFQDFAGFDTYDSMYRAQAIFQVENAIIATQRFHIARAVYIARKRGIDAIGLVSDRRGYQDEYHLELRECFARVKAWLEITFGSHPTYLGEIIPIDGPSNGEE